MSLAVVHTRARFGVQAPAVCVEVHLSNGLPGLSIVGLPETGVREAKDRVRSAIINSRFDFPAQRITINLAPADLPKEGGRYDLPIAIGILAASGQLPDNDLDQYEFLGELALTGDLRPVLGALPAALACGEIQRRLVIAYDNRHEAAISHNTGVLGARHLLDICRHLGDEQVLTPETGSRDTESVSPAPDLADVQGQHQARRALEIAAAGAHNLLFFGPPGTGKTMLASRLPGILPPLSHSEALETASVHSLTRPLESGWLTPPWRAPHHTASSVALVGGGSQPRPGEVSLAHNGVLFMDELPEFQRNALEALREPLESGEVSIARARAQLRFPARFQLVAAMNPCPCGYLGHVSAQRSCRCTAEQIQRYRHKISGPLLDRIDLHVAVNRQPASSFAQDNQAAESSAVVRQRVIAARHIQLQRQNLCNNRLTAAQLQTVCRLQKSDETFLHQALDRLDMSARTSHRILKVARTIADLSTCENIGRQHLAEALGLRALDRPV